MLKIFFLLFKILLLVFIFSVCLIILNYKIISLSPQDLVYNDIKKLPDCNYILVPGSGDSVNNFYFAERMNAVAEVYTLKKIKKIIVSGRNDLPGYDEPASMESVLIGKGIPPEIIIKKYGAERTIQSIIQTKNDFNLDSVIIVSQKAHLERALFISYVVRLHAVGYVAKENLKHKYKKYYRKREVLARLRCTYDCVKFKMKLKIN